MGELGSTNIDELINDNFEQNVQTMNNTNTENVTTNVSKKPPFLKKHLIIYF